MPRRATLHLLICTLAIVTAVGLLRAVGVVRETAVASPETDNTAAIARGFYNAVNHALRSGDTAAIAAVVAPGFVVHASSTGVVRDRAGLARYLAAVHATSPGTEIVVEDVIAGGDRAMARLGVRGTEGAFLGLRLGDRPRVWGRLDALRIADGRVVELWGGMDGLALLEPLARVSLGRELSSGQTVVLDRLALTAGGQRELGLAAGSGAVYVASGTVAVAAVPASPSPGAAPRTDRTLTTGDAVALPGPIRYLFRRAADSPSAVLLAATFPFAYMGSLQSAGAESGPREREIRTAMDGITVESLAGGPWTALPRGPVSVAFGRATLAPGAAVSLPSAAGPVLLFIEAGALGVETSGGSIWIGPGEGGASGDGEAAVLAAGDGALVPSGTAVTVRSLGGESVVALVVTVLPDGAGTEAAA